MIKFNDDNIYVGYIKELLHSFNLPTCKVKKDSSKFILGEYYIDKELEQVRVVTQLSSSGEVVESQRVCDYKFNDKILNLTKNLEIRNTYYDSYTHNYLGNYLRFLRDYLDLDLMQMYNCFSNESPKNLNIEIVDIKNSNFVYPVSSKSDYNIFMISVKPNTTYTLLLEYQNAFNIFCGFYSNNKYIEMVNTPPDSVNSLEAKTFKTISSGCAFNKPILVNIPQLTSEEEIRQEDNLKLFICLPNTYIDNIVILEGDYIKNSQTIITESGKRLGNVFFEHIPGAVYQNNDTHTWFFNDIDTHKADTLSANACEYNPNMHNYVITFADGSTWTSPNVDVVGNYDFITKNQLMEFSTSTKYLLADRLVEYLSDNVITHIDEIVENIKRVQVLIAGYDKDFNSSQYGKWDIDINKWIYKYISTHGNTGDLTYRDIYRDVLCFVDKDIESVLVRIKKSIVENENKTDREKKALKLLDALGGIYA